MPHLAKLVEQGVSGNLSTLYPVLSPMLWTSIATGKRAWRHGIHGFTEPDPAGGVRPVTNLGRKTKAIWNILNQQGMKSNVVGWWPSHPAEPINGVMVSNQFQQAVATPDKPWPLKPGTIHPPRLAEAIKEFRVHPSELTAEEIYPFVPLADKVDHEKDKRLGMVAKTLAECASIHAAATAVMQLEEWDFMAVYHDAIDHFCHGFMKYHPPRLPWIPEEDFELFKDVVNGAYQFHDLMLGAMMELAGPETTIIICSDHGFHPDHLRPRELPNEPAGPAEEHRHYGIFVAAGPGIKKDELVFGASLLDITPTILQTYGLPIGEDMDGKPLTTIFETPPDIEYVESWDRIEGDDGSHPEGIKLDPIDNQETLQQLVDLGYIDDVDTNQSKAAESAAKELKYNLARDLISSGKLPEAIEMLEQLWESYQDESRFGIQLFDCYLTMHALEKARTMLETIKARKKDYAEKAGKKLAELKEQYKEKEPDEISDQERRQFHHLQKQAHTNNHTLAFFDGRLLLAEHRYQEALDAFKQANHVQLHNRPSLLQKMGECYIALKQWREAEQNYQQILEIDPINASAHFGLAQVYLNQPGREADALEAIKTSLGLYFHNPQAHYVCGVALQRQGFQLEAIKAFETAVAQNSTLPHAYRRLARLYRVVYGDRIKAKETIKKALAARRKIQDFYAGKLSDVTDATSAIHQSASLGELGQAKVLGAPSDKEIIIVSGLPRSGTSMMMQMLEAGGITPLTDEVRGADEDNTKGYYEYEPAKARNDSEAWLPDAEGKAVKLVAQLLTELTASHHYRIIFMERPLAEVINSQTKMLERLGKQGGQLSKERLANAYISQIEKVKKILARYPEQVSILSVNYHDALEKREETTAQINRFLGGQLNEQAMREAIDPSMRKQFITPQ